MDLNEKLNNGVQVGNTSPRNLFSQIYEANPCANLSTINSPKTNLNSFAFNLEMNQSLTQMNKNESKKLIEILDQNSNFEDFKIKTSIPSEASRYLNKRTSS